MAAPSQTPSEKRLDALSPSARKDILDKVKAFVEALPEKFIPLSSDNFAMSFNANIAMMKQKAAKYNEIRPYLPETSVASYDRAFSDFKDGLASVGLDSCISLPYDWFPQ